MHAKPLIALALVLIAAVCPLQPARAADLCAADRAELARMDAEIARLGKEVLPDLAMKEMVDVITSLQKLFDGSKKDVKEVSAAAESAKARLATVKKALAEGRQALPAGWTRLESAIDKLVAGVGDGMKTVEASGAGKAMTGIKAGTDKLAVVSAALDKVKRAADLASAVGDARRGTGAEQIKALAAAFDAGLSVPGVANVPGLGDLLRVFSGAINGASGMMAPIESDLKNRWASFARTNGDLVSYGDGAYMSVRERNAAQLAALKAARDSLQAQMDQGGCDTAPAPAGAPLRCEKVDPAVGDLLRLLEARTRVLREKYEADMDLYAQGQRALLPLLRDIDPPNGTEVIQGNSALARKLSWRLETILRNPKVGIRASDLEAFGKELGVSIEGRSDAETRLSQAIRTEVDKRGREDAERTMAAYEKARAELQATRKSVGARVAELGRNMRVSRGAYAKLLRETIAQEAKAKNLTPAQLQELEDCDPRQSVALGKPPEKPASAATKPPVATQTGVAGCAGRPQPPDTVRGVDAALAVEQLKADATRRLAAAELQFSKGARALYEACFRAAGVNSHGMQYTGPWSEWFYTGSWNAAYGYYSRAQDALAASASAARSACWVRKSFEPEVRSAFDGWATREASVMLRLKAACAADAQRARVLGDSRVVFLRSFEKGNPRAEADRKLADDMDRQAEEIRLRNAAANSQFAREMGAETFPAVLP